MAFWVGSEIAAAGGSKVAVQITPGEKGIFQVILDGDIIYDKASSDYPRLPDVKTIKSKVTDRVGD